MRTNAGTDLLARVLADPASNGTGASASAYYMAFTEDATAPAAGDTTLAGELVGGGYSRAAATYNHAAGTATLTLSRVITNSGASPITVRKIGIFNAAAGGTLVFEQLVTSPSTQVNGDQLTFTVTVTL